MEVIVLAGGLGTRLQSVVADRPKPLALVGQRPFLWYLLQDLSRQNVSRVVISTGYKKEMFREQISEDDFDFEIEYSEENEALGTGGAVRLALEKTQSKDVLLCNGDTLYRINLDEYLQFHRAHKSELSIALKWMDKADRYGVVACDRETERIQKFLEKAPKSKGWINTGMILLNRSLAKTFPGQKSFSFEREFLSPRASQIQAFGFKTDGYFIDIGIPESFEQAQKEIPKQF